MKEGISGKIAAVFIHSKLSALLLVGLLLLGVYSAWLIPREEEPQINVPMADIVLMYPGATPLEVENHLVKPVEQWVSNIKGVEHVHSISREGQAMVIVQFKVGEDVERSYVKLYDELAKHSHDLPQGAMTPWVKTRSIDDVPMMALTLWSDQNAPEVLRQQADQLGEGIKKISQIAQVRSIGGRTTAVNITLQPDRMQRYGVDAAGVVQMLQAHNGRTQAGSWVGQGQSFQVHIGSFIEDVDSLRRLIVGVQGQQPVYLNQIAQVTEGATPPTEYVALGYGRFHPQHWAHPSTYPAITLAISKVKGADAMHLAEKVEHTLVQYQKRGLLTQTQVETTRNYGETASDKVGELLIHLGIAIIAVTLLVVLAMGWRGGLVVFLSVPLTFALTLFAYYLLGYTLNRITLFALVFVVGIVVDDSIIIAENMHRHFQQKRLPFAQAALYAINEVGNPTILATFTVIAAILPMAFVSGMMGPYMSPMPIGASIAMLLSLFVALTITPYLGYRFLRAHTDDAHVHADNVRPLEQQPMYRLYRALAWPLLHNRPLRYGLVAFTVLLLIGSMALFMTQSVLVKMLPFDNKNEFQVLVDMPEGTPLEQTAAVVAEMGQYLAGVPEVMTYQQVVGTASPITFNGLVRHYDLRQGPTVADIQVNLRSKDARQAQSHDIAKRIRPGLLRIARAYGAKLKVVEVPPGPPVLSTLVAEIYGPDYTQQVQLGRQVQKLLQADPNVVDTDLMTEAPQTVYQLRIDREKAMRHGIAPAQLVQNVQWLQSQQAVAYVQAPHTQAPREIRLQLSDADRSGWAAFGRLPVKNAQGQVFPLRQFITPIPQTLAATRYRKDQKKVVYVLADMAGALESPVYSILGLSDKLAALPLPQGFTLQERYMGSPDDEHNFTVKWDGEWQITLEVFRDLGIAFAVVILIIYMLIVGWFQNFKTPIVMMLAIPLSLIGVVLGHWLLGAFFTATSFIGMIALAGVMVRNSVLLIDFIEIRLREGIPMTQAIIEAGAVRTTPILLTTGAVVIGASIILFDPIFQGLAISLVFGALISTLLTLWVVPLIYFSLERRRWAALQTSISS